jgi:hypothetical protein
MGQEESKYVGPVFLVLVVPGPWGGSPTQAKVLGRRETMGEAEKVAKHYGDVNAQHGDEVMVARLTYVGKVTVQNTVTERAVPGA